MGPHGPLHAGMVIMGPSAAGMTGPQRRGGAPACAGKLFMRVHGPQPCQQAYKQTVPASIQANRASKHTSRPCQQAYKLACQQAYKQTVPPCSCRGGIHYAGCLGSGRGHGDYGIGGRRRVSFGVPSDAGMEGPQRRRHDRAQRRKILIMGPSAAGNGAPAPRWGHSGRWNFVCAGMACSSLRGYGAQQPARAWRACAGNAV